MMPAFIKVCGLRTPADAEKLEGIDVSAAGMIFVPGRRRGVTAEQGAEIAAHLPPGVLRAGVFMDPTEEELVRVFEQVSLDLVQLHGEESPDFCRWVKEKLNSFVVKVFHMGKALPAPPQAYASRIDAVLLDSSSHGMKGGTGTVFPWDAIPGEKAVWQQWKLPVWVAGGLSPSNVDQLLKKYAPEGVDVSSGVETEGIKDRNKIRGFVERVRRYEREIVV